MGLFSRRPRPDSRPDDAFPFLSTEEASHLRGLVLTTFAERGIEVSLHPDYVEDDAGTQYGLANLAATCHQEEAGRWPGLVADHVRRIVARMSQPSELDTIVPEELRRRVYPRLVGRDRADPRLFSYAREVADDLVEVLCLDQPDTVAYLTDKVFPRLGPAGPLYDAARQNLREITFDEAEVVPAQDSSFHCVFGDSVFTATTALQLGSIADAVGDPIDPERGAFFVVACRNQVAFHPWRGDDAWATVFSGLLRWAELGFSDGAGPVSPELYWWRPSGIEQLSRRNDVGEVSVELSGDLAELIEAAGGG
ncbi:hypothetical protein GCM10011519_19950 [Marmoricola endophyticus]|uniref:Uncharacterized protein n=1 Tax=Marmoricola endophyticus TaxID=2040280 RepID=A0A917BHM8_9ACTN|nr:hypothetical protein [Marmoricola endophyticus]GGF46071.1 hypothetical protein GCM10011519_19950 [Marmoricola endophyticus]